MRADDFSESRRRQISFLAEDGQTLIGRKFTAQNAASVVKIIEKLHGDPDAAYRSLQQWGHGSAWIDPTSARCEFLGINLKSGTQRPDPAGRRAAAVRGVQPAHPDISRRRA